MAGMPLRARRAQARTMEGVRKLPDSVARAFPAGWQRMTKEEQLEAMLGHSLTFGMEILCWGPLSALTQPEIAEIDRVRHDVMLLCARFGLENRKARNADEVRELAEAIARHDKK